MYAWLTTQIGADAASVTSYVVIAFALFAIAWLCLAFFRRLNNGSFPIMGKKRDHRLSVRDAAFVDSRRRLILIRRDNIEHLLLVGGPRDVVVECNINASENEKPGENKKTAQSAHATPANTNPKGAVKTKAAARIEEKAEDLPAPAYLSEQNDQEKEQAPYQPEANPEQSPQYPEQNSPYEEPANNPPIIEQSQPKQQQQQQQQQQNNIPQQNGFAQQNGAPHATAGQYPQAGSVQINVHNSPYLAGNRPIAQPSAQRAPLNQLLQQHQGVPITTSPAPSGNRQQPARQAPNNIQTASAQNNLKPPVGAQRPAVAPRPNGAQGYAPPYQGYAAQQPITSNGMSRNNSINGDLSAVNPKTAVPHKAEMSQKEPAVDLSPKKQEPRFTTARMASEEDFDKILQEELIRSQTNIKLASSHKK